MRPLVIRVAAVAAALVAAAPAAAQSPPTPNDSAASQYVEAIPSAEGATPAGANTGKKSVPLSEAAAQRLRTAGGTDAATLQRIATSPALGAPEPVRGSRRPPVPRPAVETASAAARGSLVTSVTSSGGDGRLALLAVVLAAIAAAAVFAAVRPARQR